MSRGLDWEARRARPAASPPMKILALSDQVVEPLYGPLLRERYPKIDLILGCGDLPAEYLEYVVSQYNVPLLYVPGNHDPDNYRVPGGQDIDGHAAHVKGLLVAGLGGSRRYKSDGRHQYTEAEMHLRLIPLLPRLVVRRLRRGHGADIFVTHAPPLGVHDAPDLPHIGFQAFAWLIRAFHPRLMVHGHVHVWSVTTATDTVLDGTRVLNVYPARMIELEAER
jgi:Icc-related predicted phosphoesterase